MFQISFILETKDKFVRYAYLEKSLHDSKISGAINLNLLNLLRTLLSIEIYA